MLEKRPPLVSIAIITYNQKEYLRECIESCLVQDYPEFEIVIADDGSNDGTQDMLFKYRDKYPGKFVLRLAEKNQGITANSNSALFACSGKYIAWMGGDDLMFPSKLSKQVGLMESNPNCSICYHNLDVFDSYSNDTLYYFNDKKKINGDVRTVIRFGTFNGACSNMVRSNKSPSNGFDVSLPVASDWLYWVETLANGGTIDYIDEVLGGYRRHSRNVTKASEGIDQNDLDHLVACQIIIARYPDYLPESLSRYSRLLKTNRLKLPYRHALWCSVRLKPAIKPIVALLFHIVSFGKIKL